MAALDTMFIENDVLPIPGRAAIIIKSLKFQRLNKVEIDFSHSVKLKTVGSETYPLLRLRNLHFCHLGASLFLIYSSFKIV